MLSTKEKMEDAVFAQAKAYNPYWNFWRVVFAGWLIKYPGKFFSGIFWFLLLLAMGVAYMVSPSDYQNVIDTNRRDSEGMRELPPTYRNNYEKYVFNLFSR